MVNAVLPLSGSNATAIVRPDARRHRNLQIDLMRGLALLLIFSSHFTDISVYAGVLEQGHGRIPTLKYLTWTSEAEFFIFLSGYVFGLVYMPTLIAQGFVAAQRRALGRAWTLVIANIVSLVAMLALIACFDPLPPNFLAAQGLDYLNGAPERALLHFLTLRYSPLLTDILVLYTVLIALAPSFLWAYRRQPLLALGLSFASWVTVQLWPSFNIAYEGGVEKAWFFNPFAYQFLFYFGAALGAGGWAERIAKWGGRAGLWGAMAIVVVTTSLKTLSILAQHGHLGLAPYAGLLDLPWLGRETLAPLRLAHFFVMFYLALRLLPSSERLGSKAWAKPIIACGQNSLEIFCASTFLVYLCILTLYRTGGSMTAYVLLTAGGIAATLGLSMLIRRVKRKPQASPRTDRAALADAGSVAPPDLALS